MCDTSHSEERAFLTCWPRESTTCPGILFRYRADILYVSSRASTYEESRESQSGRMIRGFGDTERKSRVRDSHSNDGRKSYFRYLTTATIFEYNNAILSPAFAS